MDFSGLERNDVEGAMALIRAARARGEEVNEDAMHILLRMQDDPETLIAAQEEEDARHGTRA
jgi:hypothetical protein